MKPPYMSESWFELLQQRTEGQKRTQVAKTLGIAPSSAYELMHEASFFALRVGSRIVVPKGKFIEWVRRGTKGGDDR